MTSKHCLKKTHNRLGLKNNDACLILDPSISPRVNSSIKKLHSPKMYTNAPISLQVPQITSPHHHPRCCNPEPCPAAQHLDYPTPVNTSGYYRTATHLNFAWILWQSGQWHSGIHRGLGIHHLYKRPKEFCYVQRSQERKTKWRDGYYAGWWAESKLSLKRMAGARNLAISKRDCSRFSVGFTCNTFWQCVAFTTPFLGSARTQKKFKGEKVKYRG